MRTNYYPVIVIGILLTACDGSTEPRSAGYDTGAANGVAGDAKASLTRTKSDSQRASPTSQTETTRAAALTEVVPSSNQECQCWPTGEQCALPWGPQSDSDPTKACPVGEQCTGSAKTTQPGGKVVGNCRRTCDLNALDTGCAAGERCEVVAIVGKMEGMIVATPSLCVVDEYPLGSDKTGERFRDKE